jgi:hypothetical protein
MNINSIIIRFCDPASRTSQSSVIHSKTVETKLQNSNKNDGGKFRRYLSLQFSTVKFAITAIAPAITAITLLSLRSLCYHCDHFAITAITSATSAIII